jgi:hypothetical protein
MKTIYEFKKGDEIVRVQPSKQFGDRSYMGEKLIYIGIENGQIYCKRTNELELAIFGDKLIDLDVDLWDSGWDLFIDPKKLLEGFEPKMDASTIEEQIKKAIKNEDYELAEKLKLKLS